MMPIRLFAALLTIIIPSVAVAERDALRRDKGRAVSDTGRDSSRPPATSENRSAGNSPSSQIIQPVSSPSTNPASQIFIWSEGKTTHATSDPSQVPARFKSQVDSADKKEPVIRLTDESRSTGTGQKERKSRPPQAGTPVPQGQR